MARTMFSAPRCLCHRLVREVFARGHLLHGGGVEYHVGAAQGCGDRVEVAHVTDAEFQFLVEVAIDDLIGGTALVLVWMRISCCLPSSRESMMTLSGLPLRPLSSRRSRTLPSEPVPPVTRISLSV